MAGLTLFTIPRAFDGHIGLIQTNAIESWRQWNHAQVILCGDEPGTADAARELGCDHLPSLRRSAYGTPFLDDAFFAAERLAQHDIIGYVNSDIILGSGVGEALAVVHNGAFLVVGRRINLRVTERIAFDDPDAEADLRERAQQEGRFAPPLGSDYFLYRRGTLGVVPPFAVGRAYWDNWMMYRARQAGWPLIDATAVIGAIHQNHAYDHVPGVKVQTWDAPEAQENLRLAGGYRAIFTLADATHVLSEKRLLPSPARLSLQRIARRLDGLPGAGAIRSAYRLARRLWH